MKCAMIIALKTAYEKFITVYKMCEQDYNGKKEFDDEILFDFFKDRKRIITDRSGKIPYSTRYYVFLKDRKNFPILHYTKYG